MASGNGSSDINLMVAFSQKLEVHIGFSAKLEVIGFVKMNS